MLVLAVVPALAFAAVGCGGSDDSTSSDPTAAGQPQMGGTLQVGIQAGTGEYDPVKIDTTADGFLIH